ncbi:MAG: helix-turn-helix domain-containing protein [Bacteriovoracaceae bacterium]|nr:helix-turn-helix domain-containing protein [Bacteriovoracaceae bacterium]
MEENQGFSDNSKWMTSAEVAKFLRKSDGAIRVMVHRRQIRAKKFCNRLYFCRKEISRLLVNAKFVGELTR